MVKTGQFVAFAVVVLALSGCSAAGASAPAGDVKPEVVASAEPTSEPTATPTAEPVAAPIVAAPIAAAPEATESQTEAQKNGFIDENDWYLRSIRAGWTGELPTDEQLLGAGKLACDGLAAGTRQEDVIVVQGEGEDALNNNRNLVGYALMALCP